MIQAATRRAASSTQSVACARWLCAGGLILAIGLPGCSTLEDLFADKGSQRRRDRVMRTEADGREHTGEEPPVYSGTTARHYLARVLDDGATLVLEDGSIWRVVPADCLYSAGWKNLQDIVVQDMLAAPQYKLVNTSSREQVQATYLGTPREL